MLQTLNVKRGPYWICHSEDEHHFRIFTHHPNCGTKCVSSADQIQLDPS